MVFDTGVASQTSLQKLQNMARSDSSDPYIFDKLINSFMVLVC